MDRRQSLDAYPEGMALSIVPRASNSSYHSSYSHNNRRSSQFSLLNDSRSDGLHHADDRNWSWSHLRFFFRQNELGGLYDRYQRRLQNSYFNVFLLVQGILSLFYIAIMLYFSLVHTSSEPPLVIKGCDNSTAGIHCNPKDKYEILVPEIVVHVVISLYCFVVFAVVKNEKLFQSIPNLQIVASILTCIVILGVELALSVYYYQTYRLTRTPSAFQTVIVVYFFLPVPRKRQAVLLGGAVAISHLMVSGLLFYRKDSNKEAAARLIAADTVFYICTNAVGFYSRLLTEITIRRAFMDRRGYIKSTIKKLYEQEQEDGLLRSILPAHISDKAKTELRNAIMLMDESRSLSLNKNSMGNGNRSSHRNAIMHHKKPFSDGFVERHDNVTILYADIVNFTPLTVKFRADELVETLNELFGRFDDAATVNGCVRIKLLGDCYYCVAGLNDPSSNHAKNSILLGFEMIEIIKDLREKLKVDLAMRIGVHSGNILSGLLGIYKWQFDIWSKDVTIAQHMEQSGKPGWIHITKATKEYLADDFIFKPANGHLRDAFLKENNVETFFVLAKSIPGSCMTKGSIDEELDEVDGLGQGVPKFKFLRSFGNPNAPSARRGSLAVVGKSLIKRKSLKPAQERRSNLSGNDVMRYLNMMGKVNEQMEKAIDEMPLRRPGDWCLNKNHHKNSITEQVNPYTMSFRKLTSEVHFQTQQDPLFKYYVGCSIFVLLCIGIIQAIIVPSGHIILWLSIAGGTSCLLIILPLVWIGHIWNRLKDPHREHDTIPEPENRIVLFFYNYSKRVTNSWLSRTVLYLIVTLIICFVSISDVLECKSEEDCKFPWYFTYSSSLAILVIYSFFRIHYILKLLVNVISMLVYFVVIYVIRREVFSQNTGVSPAFSLADYEVLSHLIFLLWTSSLLHVMDRQMEYINRLDFIWKRKLTEEHKEASLTHAVNKMLIHNILPEQIAKIYLNPNRAGEGYSRTYQNVSIMFASIPNFMNFYTENEFNKQGVSCLKVLDQIITEFDQALFNHRDVEKIKVIGSTYMAACGLEVQETGRLSTISFVGNNQDENPYNHNGEGSGSSENPAKRRRTLSTLVEFAADMMFKLEVINREAIQDFQLRVGIATGLVVAGVVGATKPLFDTWSDTVNLASRLDSHGKTGKIHITEHAAVLLNDIGIQCEPLQKIKIKGKGEMWTTFVCMDQNGQIKRMDFRKHSTQL